MSGDKLRVRDLSRELEAALLGDFDVLRDGSPDAKHFAASFSNQGGQRWWQETEPKDSLASRPGESA